MGKLKQILSLIHAIAVDLWPLFAVPALLYLIVSCVRSL